jgi:hypothetical protein
MIQKKSCRENQNTIRVHGLFIEHRVVYEIIWKNIVERGIPQMAIWRMRIACWVTKATQIHCHNM